MNIEYRTSHGQRMEVNANGRVVPGSGQANLRAMGCPEHIARKVENSAILRRAAKAMEVGHIAVGARLPIFETDEYRQAQVAEANRKAQADAELKDRMQRLAGISHGRR